MIPELVGLWHFHAMERPQAFINLYEEALRNASVRLLP
jgi:hypothetical protein